MPVLVTGATGFIGRRVVRRLVASGDDVRALVMPGEDTSVLTDADGGEIAVVRGDITDPAAVADAVRGVERVYHLAAVVGDWGDDAVFEAVNVGGTRNVLDAAASEGCNRVLMVSSIVVYGSQLHDGICDESAPREFGVGPYSRTKRASEELALDYHHFGRVPVTVVRPGNVYGPGSGLWVDEVLAIMKKGTMPVVDGGGGDATLAYVDNVVDVIIRAARSEQAAGRIYNANDGSGVSWRRYAEDLAEIAGLSPKFRSIPHSVAIAMARAMERSWKFFGRKSRPLLTVEAAVLLGSQNSVPIRRAIDELGYTPIDYREAMEHVAAYVHGGTTL